MDTGKTLRMVLLKLSSEIGQQVATKATLWSGSHQWVRSKQ